MKNQSVAHIGLLLLLLLSVGCYYPVVAVGDVDEAANVQAFLSESYSFPAAFGAGPKPYFTHVGVYGIFEEPEQEKIRILLKREGEERGWKPIRLRFIEKEIFFRRENTEARTITLIRGDEKILKEIWIND